MTARFKVNQQAFIAPHTVLAGSIIETTAEPALNWTPLNPEAEAAMERLYTKEYKHVDEKGVVVTTQPHLSKRPTNEPAAEPLARPTVELISAPVMDLGKSISLAESQFSRPEPDLVARGDGTAALRSAEPTPPSPKTSALLPNPGDVSDDASTTIIAPAPPAKEGLFG